MKFDCLKDCRAVCFVAGAAAAVVGKKILTSPKTREICVSGLAKGMMLRQEAEEAFKNMREDAEDLCCEAQQKASSEDEADEV